MRTGLATAALVLLAGCAGMNSTETYTCPNGPDLAVSYSEDTALLAFPDGRVISVQRVDPNRPDFYAAPGVSWDATMFRRARYTDETRSLLCDQLGG